MNTLVVVGTSAAYLYSVATILFPDFFRAAGLGAGGEELPLYFDTAAAIITLILAGRYLEARARSSTSDAMRRLIGLAPRTARVLRDGQELEVPIASVAVGDVVRVRPGEKIAVDGVGRGRSLCRRREHGHGREHPRCQGGRRRGRRRDRQHDRDADRARDPGRP